MPSLSEIMSAMPTASQYNARQAEQQATLDSLTAQTQGQQIQNMQRQAQYDDYMAAEGERDLKRRIFAAENQFKLDPNYQKTFNTTQYRKAANELSDADAQYTQNVLDAGGKGFDMIANGDIRRGMEWFEKVAPSSPILQEFLQSDMMQGMILDMTGEDPSGQPLPDDVVQQRAAEGILRFKNGLTMMRGILESRAGRATADTKAKYAHEIEMEKLKSANALELEREKQTAPGKDKYYTYSKPNKQTQEDFITMVSEVEDELGLDKGWFNTGVDEDTLGQKLAEDYAVERTKYVKGDPALPLPSEYIRAFMTGASSQTTGATPTEGFVGIVSTKEQYDKLPSGTKYTAPDGKEYIKK